MASIAMQRLREHYPDDSEAAIFYALALNGAVDFEDKNYTKQLQAAAILNEQRRNGLARNVSLRSFGKARASRKNVCRSIHRCPFDLFLTA